MKLPGLGLLKRFLFGDRPLAVGIEDQISDKQAERKFGTAWIILCAGLALAVVILAFRC